LGSIKAIRGFKDVLPAESPLWSRVERAAAEVLSRFGFREMRIPVVEKTELFARSIGETTDIVEKEMFTFPDRRGDKLTLRPEATAGIVRSVLEHNLVEGARPLKVYFMGPMFRYERPQKGRQRQFHQLDVEVFNDESPESDAELIVVLDHYLKSLDLANVTMHVNSLGCKTDRPGYRDQLIAYFEDKQDRLCEDCRRRLKVNPLRVIDCKVEGCRETAAQAPVILDSLCPECESHFERVKEHLAAAGVAFEIDPRLVRGLDYYCRTTYEALAGDLGAQNAVAGGGRYDGLAEALGGPNIPGSGFALGFERLVMLLAARESVEAPRPSLYVAALDDESAKTVFPLIQDLRRRGVYVETDYQPGSLKSRLKRADKTGADRVLVVGPEELARGEGMLRDMRTREQSRVPLDDAVRILTEILV
jgi:histidyl-tRNA synthetase